MGKIFSPEAVASHTVPEAGAHEAAADDLCGRLREDSRATDIDGIVFGSVVLGHVTLRSDLDLLSITSREADVVKASELLANHVKDVRTTWQVPVEADVITPIDIRTRRHQITEDSLFAEHLLSCARQNSHTFGDPTSRLLPLSAFNSAQEQLEAAIDITRRYAAKKRKEFLAVIVAGDALHLPRLQRAFELPSSLARKLIRLNELAEWAGEHTTPNISYAGREFYSRRLLAKGVLRLLEGTPGKDSAQWLVEHDAEYTQLLHTTLEGDTSIDEYTKWLKSVHRPALQHALKLTAVAALHAEEQATLTAKS